MRKEKVKELSSMRNVTKYLMEGDYTKFVESFPQDRLARVEAAKIIVDIVASMKSEQRYIKGWHSAESPRNPSIIETKSFKDYDIVIVYDVQASEELMIHFTELTVVLGEDDSGVWIEVLGRVLVKEDEINGMLGNSVKLKGAIRNKRYRIQGDIILEKRKSMHSGFDNLSYFPTKLGEWLMKHPPYYDDAFRFMAEFLTDRKPFEGKDEEEFAEIMQEVNDEFLGYTGANKTWREYDFQNHRILLYNATFMTIGNNAGSFEVPSTGGKLKIMSEHHKTVEVNLPVGVYSVFKSGGLSIENLRRSCEIFSCPIYNSKGDNLYEQYSN